MKMSPIVMVGMLLVLFALLGAEGVSAPTGDGLTTGGSLIIFAGAIWRQGERILGAIERLLNAVSAAAEKLDRLSGRLDVSVRASVEPDDAAREFPQEATPLDRPRHPPRGTRAPTSGR